MATVLPGGKVNAQLDLAPGTYVATCFVRDEMAPHLPHAAMGMVVEFTVH
jgi:hypothetical protein